MDPRARRLNGLERGTCPARFGASRRFRTSPPIRRAVLLVAFTASASEGQLLLLVLPRLLLLLLRLRLQRRLG